MWESIPPLSTHFIFLEIQMEIDGSTLLLPTNMSQQLGYPVGSAGKRLGPVGYNPNVPHL